VNIDEAYTDNISSMNDTSLPITGICIVTKANNVPTGYQCIRKGSKHYDSSMYLCTIFSSLCFTRIYPLAGNKTLVLEDIKLINERDSLTPQYTALTQTVDTLDKCTAKRLICVKLVERQAGMKCVCDIIFLYRSKRPPQFYTLIGEINGLQMCIKEGSVPSLRAPPPIPTSNLYPDPLNYQSSNHMDTTEHSHTNTLLKKSDEKEILDGIPFQINPKYLNSNRNGTNDLLGLDSIQILSAYELDQQFNYDFKLEQSSIHNLTEHL
jgi:ESCRT-I complex subunit MVB12